MFKITHASQVTAQSVLAWGSELDSLAIVIQVWEADIARRTVLDGQLAWPAWKVLGRWETLSHKTRWIAPEEQQLKFVLRPPHTCKYTSIPTPTHKQAYTQNKTFYLPGNTIILFRLHKTLSVAFCRWTEAQGASHVAKGAHLSSG